MISFFHQGEFWIDAEGTVIEIEFMDPDHAHNVVLMLYPNREAIRDGIIIDEITWITEHVYGEIAQDDMLQASEAQMKEALDQWFEGLPLIRALRARVPEKWA